MAESDFIADGNPVTLTHTIHPLTKLNQLVIPVTDTMDVRLTKIPNRNSVTYLEKHHRELSVGYVEGTGTEGVVEYYLVTIVGDAREARKMQMTAVELTATAIEDVVEYQLQRLGYTARTDDDAKILLPFHRRVIYHDIIPAVVHQFHRKQEQVLMDVEISEAIVSFDGTAVLIPRKKGPLGKALLWEKEERGTAAYSTDSSFPYRFDGCKGLEFEKAPIIFEWWRLESEKVIKELGLVVKEMIAGAAILTQGRHALRNDGSVHVLVQSVVENAYGAIGSYRPVRYFRDGDGSDWMVVSMTGDDQRWEHPDLWQGDERAQKLVAGMIGNQLFMLSFHMRYYRLLKGKPFDHPNVRWGIDKHDYNTKAQTNCVTDVGLQVARFGKSTGYLLEHLPASLPEWAAGYRDGKLPEVPVKITKTVITFGNDWENGMSEATDKPARPKEVEAPPLIVSSEGPVAGDGWWPGFSGLWKKLFGK